MVNMTVTSSTQAPKRRRRRISGLVALCLLGTSGLRGSWRGRWLPLGAVSVLRPEGKLGGINELNLASSTTSVSGLAAGSLPIGCEAAFVAGRDAFDAVHGRWQASLDKGLRISSLGDEANHAMRRALDDFDKKAEVGSVGGACGDHRARLEELIKEKTAATIRVARSLTEDAVAREFRTQLVRAMRRRGRPLRVREKMMLLRDAVASFRRESGLLDPEWVTTVEEQQHDRDAYMRLGELQFGIERSSDGVALSQRWELKQNENALSKRAHGIKVSFDPALRVMFRPEGMGNLQIFSAGPVGPPNKKALVNIGVLNDGSMADVFREHPTPPKVAVQPAVKVNLDIR
eukprot:TRINITY_DN44699_c0_g1_i1.p1 TRINITY_DN44699_c0_g1~~TRINITY_DN44699_c0_g1_i1.p1  ORF type:complete len:353 (+),score=71.77 TRINITY_DN44699_c0_g1_i1:23-1060(+)